MALTEQQKRTATILRENALTMPNIAERLNAEPAEIKRYLYRSNIQPLVEEPPFSNWCSWCGKGFMPPKQYPKKRFCSDAHRLAWWAANRSAINGRTQEELTCLNCGKPFTAFACAGRKYCDHGCYIQHRYGTKGGKQ
ncbi:hypothetical protein ACTOVL_04350 [Arcanobacterium canis]